MRSFTAPPRSIEFSKFVEFTLLLANPQDLKEQIAQFAEATSEYKEAAKQYNDAVKIAKTVDVAEALKLANEEEAQRLSALNKALDEQERSNNKVLSDGKQALSDSVTEQAKIIEAKQRELDNSVSDANANLASQREAIDRREKELLEGQTTLNSDLTNFNSRKARVDEAFANS
ncbi:hypothetical protein LCGC14_1528820 [marine sediment metagenome]|uniref:Uncharacterized protein n=1 Tax=marine sediment metagenome TaxID=412755 RepID=A0A0F9IWT2_9ZZZZ